MVRFYGEMLSIDLTGKRSFRDNSIPSKFCVSA